MHQFDVAAADPEPTGAAFAVHVEHGGDRWAVQIGPDAGADANAIFVDAHAHVGARHAHVDVVAQRTHAELRLFDLQLAEPLETLERIAGLLVLARQADRVPAPVGFLLQGKGQFADLEFGQRPIGKQARIHRDLQLRATDVEHVVAFADAQVAEREQGAAASPYRLGAGEAHRLTDAFAQPAGDLLRMLLDQRQQLVHHTHDRRQQDQQHQRAVAQPSARVPQVAAQGGFHRREEPAIRAAPRRTVPARTARRPGSGWTCRGTPPARPLPTTPRR